MHNCVCCNKKTDQYMFLKNEKKITNFHLSPSMERKVIEEGKLHQIYVCPDCLKLTENETPLKEIRYALLLRKAARQAF